MRDRTLERCKQMRDDITIQAKAIIDCAKGFCWDMAVKQARFTLEVCQRHYDNELKTQQEERNGRTS